MAGRGFPPKPAATRRNAHPPARGEWQPTPLIGWQHGEIPKPPTRLTRASRAAWATWMGSWFAAHWSPDDLPMLRLVIRLYDKVDRDEATAAQQSELRQLADSYGITKKGQQDRRWVRPKDDEEAAPDGPTSSDAPASPYGGLRLVAEA